MFDSDAIASTEGLRALVVALSAVGGRSRGGCVGGGSDGCPGVGGDVERVDLLAELERVKAAAAAAQARVTAAFVESQEQVAAAWRQRARECSDAGDFDGWRTARERARAASLTDARPSGSGRAGSGSAGSGSASASRRGRRRDAMSGVAAQVALARHESPVRGAAHVKLALALTRDMPHALAALAAGQISEWRAEILVRETATLSTEQRSLVDTQIAGSPDRRRGLARLGDRELSRQVRAHAYRLDPSSAAARSSRAQADRRVTIRPAPDTMAYVTALLPVAQAVAAHAALTVAADTARAGGDVRGKGQVMADTLVARVTGQQRADAVPVEVQLLMTDRSLLAGDVTPAQLPGYGTVPAGWARDLLARSAGAHQPDDNATAHDSSADTADAAAVWLRRLYTHPGTGALVGMDSTRRVFDGGLRRFLLARDAHTCRTPWCDAPARHLDHVRDHALGGPTSTANAQGLCVRCNHTKQLPGWSAVTLDPGLTHRHRVQTATPTGHRYTSSSPPLLPGAPPAVDEEPADSVLEHHLALALAA